MAFHCDYSKFKSFVVFSQVKEGCKVLQLIILVEYAITIIVGVFVIFQAIPIVVVILCICFAVPIEILILIEDAVTVIIFVVHIKEAVVVVIIIFCILDTITVGIIVSPPSRNKRPRDKEETEQKNQRLHPDEDCEALCPDRLQF